VRRRVPIAVAVLTLLAAAIGEACPVCTTGTGEAVRAGIVTDFGTRLLAIVAPFPVLIAVVALLHRGWPPWRSS
jgi:hypothetical protein